MDLTERNILSALSRRKNGDANTPGPMARPAEAIPREP
jgi:hypothetical protein